ncbi:uncharacterized membrane protein (DUF485 family) [Murinocardiopsis flavida]|uniref:Uncharacterized membrane protein (DUF485 family) n=1 Tax=Murinocardiopsis flavida TaxID=645275 RepID=A0A2P8CMQ5_9ACTN|nr:uncharacterized membrane protein (DUF485 family) [Murinocardiopsis flavida]
MSSASRGSPDHGTSAEADLARRSVAMHSDPRFIELKRRLRIFIFPMSAAFLAWYLLYVLMSAYARDFMATVLFGQVNVALLFGLLQFVTTFGIAILYSRYAGARLDPLSEKLRDELNNGSGPGPAPAGGASPAPAPTDGDTAAPTDSSAPRADDEKGRGA